MQSQPADQAVLDRITDQLVEALDEVDASTLGDPTPCGDWSVRDLLDHVTGGNRFTVEILGGTQAQDALAAARSSFGRDDDPCDGVRTSAEDQRRAFSANDLDDGRYDHVAGQLTGTQILRLRIHDMSIHVWDLHQAVNSRKGLDPIYVRWAIAELADPESLTAKHMATGLAQPRTPLELLLAFGRRRNGWRS